MASTDMEWYTALTEEGADAYLWALDEIGWFQLPQNDRALVAERLQRRMDPKEFVCDLHHLCVDAEGFADEAGYAALLDEVITLCGIGVDRKELRFDPAARQVHVTITTPRATYAHTVELNGDWLEEGFLDRFINDQVLAVEGVQSRFHTLPIVDQLARSVFVPPALHAKAITAGVIPNRRFLLMDDDDL